MAEPEAIFDTALIRRRLVRAASRQPAEFLLSRVIDDLIERIGAVRREFTAIADIGTPAPHLCEALARRWPRACTVQVAPFFAAARGSEHVVGDCERLPLAPSSFDLATSALALQTANDLPGALIQIRRALMPDGLFLGAVVGGHTLRELRSVLTEAEATVCGGSSPRVAPFVDVRDMGALLQRAGFALPVADSDCITVRYRDMFALMADLRAMGATNALIGRTRRPTRRKIFRTAAALYAERFAGSDGRVRATFEIVSLSGWAPHASQQRPAQRGSGQVNLAAVLGRGEDKKPF